MEYNNTTHAQTMQAHITACKASGITLTAYPNPATTEFALSVEGGTTEKIEILVTNIQGQTVYQAKGTSNKKYRFGNSFMRGIYIVKVVQGNSVQMIKVIKG